MILQILLSLLGAVLLYAIAVRFLWRKKRMEQQSAAESTRERKALTLYMLPSQAEEPKDTTPAKTDNAEDQESDASKELHGWGFQHIGTVGESMPKADWLLLPLTTLYCKLWPHPVFANCKISADKTTLALSGVMDTPLVLVSAFGNDGILITSVGDLPQITEENRVKQWTATSAKAWRRHSATVATWERDGQVASRDIQHIWKMASIGIEDIIWSKHFDHYDREAYFQKTAFIACGAAFSLLLGIGIALWL